MKHSYEVRRSPSPIALLCLFVARQQSGSLAGARRGDASANEHNVYARASTLLRPIARLSRAVASLPNRLNHTFAAFLDRFVNLILSIANAGCTHFAQAGITSSPDGAVLLSAPAPYGWTSLDLDIHSLPSVCEDTMTDPLPPAFSLPSVWLTSSSPAPTQDTLTAREWDNGARDAIMTDPVDSPDDTYSMPPMSDEPESGCDCGSHNCHAQEVYQNSAGTQIALETTIEPPAPVLPAAPLSGSSNGHVANGKAPRKRKVKETASPAPSDQAQKLAIAAGEVAGGASVRAAAKAHGLSKNTLTRFIARANS